MEEIKKLLEAQRDVIRAMSGSVDGLVTAQKVYEDRLKDLEARMTPRKVSLPGVNEGKEQFSFMRAISAIVTNDWSNAGFEKEVFENTRKKAMSAGSDTAGGYIVPSQYVAELIELFRAEAIVAQLGATMLDNLVGFPIEMPKQTGGATAYWVGENAAITESEQTLGQIALTPKAVAALVKLSNRLLKNSNPSVEAMIRSDIATVLALKVDLAALRGSGANTEPIGIANTPSINTVTLGTNGAVPTFDDLYNMQYELQLDNAYRGNLAFAFHPAIRKVLLQTKIAQFSGDTAGDYIIQPMVSDSQLVSWLGHPYKMTTQIPIDGTKGTAKNCTEIYFGNWKEMLIGSWGGLEIMASKETSDAFEKNQTWIRIIQEVDIAVRHPESFCLISDAKIAS